jgi:hypothetical protein
MRARFDEVSTPITPVALSGALSGRGDGARSPRATARISSRRSRIDLFVIVFPLIDIDDVERNTLDLAGAFNRSEEIHQQAVGIPEFIGNQFCGLAEPVPMIELYPSVYAVSIIKAKKPHTIDIMKGE